MLVSCLEDLFTTHLHKFCMRLTHSKQHFFVPIGYLITSLLLHYPITFNLSTHIVGRPYEDVFEVLWQLAWLKQAVFELQVNPFYTPNVYYPVGWHLASGAQPVWYLLLLTPLTAVFGPVTTYNLAVLMLCALAGYGTYLLAHEVSGASWGSAVAGVAYMVLPALTLRFGGHLHVLISAAVLPFAYWAVFKAIQVAETPYKWSVLAGVFLGCSILGHWYFIFITSLPLIGLIVWHLTIAPDKVNLGKRLVVIGFVCAAVVAPFALLTHYARQADIDEVDSYTLLESDSFGISPDHLLWPNPLHPLWGEPIRAQIAGEHDYISLGITTTILAVIGLWSVRQRRLYGFLFTAVIAFILALGPSLHWQGMRVEVEAVIGLRWLNQWLLSDLPFADGRVAIPMPAAFLHRYLPLYNSMRVGARFFFVLALMIAIFAAFGVQTLQKKWPSVSKIVTFVAISFILFEGFSVPYWAISEVAQNDRPELAAWLQNQPLELAIIEYPLPTVNKLAMYRQASHRHPVANGYMSFEPRYWREAAPILGEWPTAAALPLLREWGIDFVIINGLDDISFTEGTLTEIQAVEGLCFVKAFPEGYMGYTATYLFTIAPENNICPLLDSEG